MSGVPCAQVCIVLGNTDKFQAATQRDGDITIASVRVNPGDEILTILSSSSATLRRLAATLSEAADKADAAIRPVIPA